MNNINELTILKEMHNIEYAKSKYFFMGLIISFIPYTGILLIANKMNMSNIFIYTIVGFTIISCIVNGILLSKSIYKKLIFFFENKYEITYQEAKELIK